MKYTEYKEKVQEEFNKLPIFYAFGERQFNEQLEKRGIKREEAADKLYSFGNLGGFYLKTDAPLIREFLNKDTDAELRRLMEEDLEFACEAFEYEMANHEYPINWQGDYDVCGCFGDIEYGESKGGFDYLTELGFSDKVIAEYYKAKNHILRTMEY